LCIRIRQKAQGRLSNARQAQGDQGREPNLY